MYPNKEQEILFAKTFGCVRFVYNKMLADRKEIYEKYKDNKEELKKQKLPTPAKYKEEFPWLKEVDSLALANAQMNLQTAYNNFFKNKSVFSNKYSLIFDTNVNVILHKSGINNELSNDIEQIIEHNEGIEKQYFLFRNYHKDSQMWRLEDMRCIWGMVHESYKPLQREYLHLFKMMIEAHSVNQYVEQDTLIELEESDMGTRNYI